MICVSCNYEHENNYCPNCGERSGVKKITLISIIESAISSVTNMDRGLLFNVKTLITKPQKFTSTYIDGKRRGILNPISFLVIIVSVYLLVLTFYNVSARPEAVIEIPKKSLYHLMYKISFAAGKFIRAYLKFFWILSILPLALSMKIIFKKYNYIEHLAISSFVIGLATLAGIFSYLIFRIPLFFDPIVYLVILVMIYKVFLNKNEKIISLILSTVVLFLFASQLFSVVLIIGLIMA